MSTLEAQHIFSFEDIAYLAEPEEDDDDENNSSLSVPLRSKSKSKKRKLYISTDAEWDNETLAEDGKPLGFICSQLYDGHSKYIYWNDRLSSPLQERILSISKAQSIKSIFIKYDDDAQLLSHYMAATNVPRGTAISLLMFLSPKDVEYVLSWNSFKEILASEKLMQRRNISGSFSYNGSNISIKDMAGWATSFKSLLEATGLSTTEKNKMDKYKATMLEGLRADTDAFVSYSMSDASDARKAFFIFIEQLNNVERLLGIAEDERYTARNVPMTTGSIVSQTTKKWMRGQCSNKAAFDIAMFKLGEMSLDNKKIDEKREKLENIVKAVTAFKDAKPEHSEQLQDIRWNVLGFSQCSVKTFAQKQNDSSIYAAAVHGGRCNNELYMKYSLEHMADMDMSGCYGNALALQHLCMGKPRIISYINNKQRTDTFGAVYGKLKDKLTDGQWMAVINGKLSFTQDILYSKLVDAADIAKACKPSKDDDGKGILERDNDVSKIDAQLVLLRHELRNVVITSDVYKLVWAVASIAEKAELNNASVETFIYYDKADKCSSMDEYISAVLADNGKHNVHEDKRTFAYFPLMLEGFIGTLLAARDVQKKMAKDSKLTEENRAKAAGQQIALKLFINTLYGCSASVFKDISNVVLANNITAKARMGSWQMAKALACPQIITDGGFVQLMKCRFINGAKKPSLATFSDADALVKHRGISVAPLAELPWDIILQETDNALRSATDKDAKAAIWKSHCNMLDKYVSEHLKAFWAQWELSFYMGADENGEPEYQPFPYKMEAKEHTTFRLSFMGKADYAFKRIGSDMMEYVIRGKDKGAADAPIFSVLSNIQNGSDIFPSQLSYKHKYLLKLGLYNTAQKSNEGAYPLLRNSRPGDMIIETRIQTFNNKHIYLKDVEMYEQIAGRKTKKTLNKQTITLPLFERHHEKGIAFVHGKMMKNSLR